MVRNVWHLLKATGAAVLSKTGASSVTGETPREEVQSSVDYNL